MALKPKLSQFRTNGSKLKPITCSYSDFNAVSHNIFSFALNSRSFTFFSWNQPWSLLAFWCLLPPLLIHTHFKDKISTFQLLCNPFGLTQGSLTLILFTWNHQKMFISQIKFLWICLELGSLRSHFIRLCNCHPGILITWKT